MRRRVYLAQAGDGSESDSLVRLALGCGCLCLLLAAHLGIDDLVFRLGLTPHCQRYLDPCNASQMELNHPVGSPDLGHAEHRHSGHRHCLVHGDAGCLSGNQQHHSFDVVHPARCPVGHCLDPLNQFADLRASMDCNCWSKRLRWRHINRHPFDRFLCKASL